TIVFPPGGNAVDLLERLREHRRQEEHLAWQGTFAEYYELVKANQRIAAHAHAREYDMIVSHGVEEAGGRKRNRIYAQDMFGLVEEYFHSAARRLDVRKRILLLMGPVSGGKSTIVTLLKRGLEAYSRTEAGAVYAIKGCPMHEEPLHLIPPELRPEAQRELGIPIEGSLCPACRVMLREEYNGIVEDVLVHRIALSEENRVGIGTFQPSDPKSQDIPELTGSIDFS